MQKSLESSLLQAKKSGFFAYPGQNLKTLPQELLSFADLQLPNTNWWESMPLQRLDLSNNQLSTLPSSLLPQNPGLFQIRVQNNSITAIPDDFFPAESQLKSIDLSNNKMTEFPMSLGNNSLLVELVLSSNQLSSLPDMGRLGNLESMQLNSNKIVEFPLIANLKKLKMLNLAENRIVIVESSALKGLILLQQLILRKNLIKYVQIPSLQSLQILDLSENQLESFILEKELPVLDTLLLAFNRLKSIGDLYFLPNLTVLDLKNNKLLTLDSSISTLKKLKTLDISNNDLPDLPNELGNMSSLVRISCIGNPMKTIKQTLREAKAEVLKQFLRGRSSIPEEKDVKSVDQWEIWLREFLINQGQELSLRDKGIESLSQRIWGIGTLKCLDLSKNKLRSVDLEEFGEMKGLRTLRINENVLEEPPKGADRLEFLQELELQGNRLKDFKFPKLKMDSFKRLVFLDLSRNFLKSVPDLLSVVPSLKILNLSYNQLNDFEILCTPAHNALEVLDLSNNRIAEIPNGLWQCLSALGHLNLENNEIFKIPTEVGFLKLQSLKIDGNPVKLLRREVIQKGTVEIMNFLRNRHVGEKPEFTRMEIEEEVSVEKGFQGNKDIEKPEMNQKRGSKVTKEEPFVEEEEEEEKKSVETLAKEKMMLEEVTKRITTIEEELESNYGMNKFQKEAKRKELRELVIKRNQLTRK